MLIRAPCVNSRIKPCMMPHYADLNPSHLQKSKSSLLSANVNLRCVFVRINISVKKGDVPEIFEGLVLLLFLHHNPILMRMCKIIIARMIILILSLNPNDSKNNDADVQHAMGLEPSALHVSHNVP